MNAIGLISAAWPRHAAKHIERGTGCTTRQAWRIASTGYIPNRLRLTLIRLIDEALDRQLAEVAEARKIIKEARYEGILETAAARRGETRAAGAVLGPVVGTPAPVAGEQQQLDLTSDEGRAP